MTVDPIDLPVRPRPYPMHNQIQPYEWGTRDGEAFIPHLLGFEPEPGQPYAELWIGAHPKAPSKIEVDGEMVSLDRWIEAYPQETLGPAVVERFGPRLPFLMKVLSAGEALSIQAHPNKIQAVALHASHPEYYPDDNHKPEIAVVLDSLSSLVGIKSLAGLWEALDRNPELAGFLGRDSVSRFREAYAAGPTDPGSLSRDLLTRLLRRSVAYPQELLEALNQADQRLRSRRGSLSEAENLFLELLVKYPGPDVGLFFLFLLNLVHLHVGQAIFTPAGLAHAHLKGNIIECMANSDNVVRVGLTSKFKDAATLLEILDYEPRPAQILEGEQDSRSDLSEVSYLTPSDEFQVTRLRLEAGQETSRTTCGRIGLLLATQGQIHIGWGPSVGVNSGGMQILPGHSVLLPAILDEYRLQASQPVEAFLAEVP